MPGLPVAPWTIDRALGRLADAPTSVRRLSDLPGLFADGAAFDRAVADGDPVVYCVSSIEADATPGALSFGLGRIEPGRVGREFYMTKGHVHAWRPAAEVYVGLAGRGVMLLHDLTSGDHRALRLDGGDVVYVPGDVAHRTVNVGDEPLDYLGIYPASAGHDYAAILGRPFPQRVLTDPVDGWRLEPFDGAV